MKKILFGLLALFLTVGTFAQDAKKNLRKATTALTAYNVDKSNNQDKLDEAKNMIEGVMNDAEYGATSKAWQTRGEIYASYAEQDYTMMALNPEHKPTEENIENAMIAADSYEKALSYAEKKFETKDALDELRTVGDMLNSFANSFIAGQEYAKAYKPLDKVTAINATLNANDREFLTEADLNNHLFVTAYTATAAGENDRAMDLFKQLYEGGQAEAGVYATYANLLMQNDDKEGGLKVLSEGRTKFPDNSEILFAEINYYITEQDYNTLQAKLSEAIEKEPNNAGLYSALGNVYMNLFTEAYATNDAKNEEYFNQSLEYFNKAVEIDANQIDATYSIGSLYFNKAVELNKKQSALGMSKEDQQLYTQYGDQMAILFDQALPYFEKAYAAKPQDRNTLIALKEIYARKNDFEKSNKFKAELDALD